MIAKNWFALEISRQDLLDNVDSTMKIQAINKAFQLAVMDDLLDTEQAVDTAVISGQPGATIGRVGVPHNPKMDPTLIFFRNTSITSGPASVTTYDKQVLLGAVLKGEIHPRQSVY